MTALAKEKSRRQTTLKLEEFTLKSGNKAFKGGRACLDTSTGKAVVATAAVGLIPLGCFDDNCDATSADKTCTVDLETEVQIEWFVNATSTDAIVAADIGKVCYIVDDQTVGILPAGRSIAGRIWRVDSVKGVGVQKLEGSNPLEVGALPAYAANDSIPTTLEHEVIYDVPTTGAASTVTLPAAALDGTRVYFSADGTKNGHTVQYRDATGTVNLTTALTASKRHLVVAVKIGGKWTANAYVAP